MLPRSGPDVTGSEGYATNGVSATSSVSQSRSRMLRSTEGFARFYEEHSRGLLIFFARRVLDPELALDLTAETFAQALLSRGRFRGTSTAEAAGWLYGIARHQLAQYHRRGSAERRAIQRLGLQVPELSEADHDRVEELAGMDRLRTAARNGMSELSESERAAVSLRIVDELPYAEVAGRLEISEAAARARVSRGLRALGSSLADEFTDRGDGQ
jgi:RNA polymerase sigma factor (sigma-70 family)